MNIFLPRDCKRNTRAMLSQWSHEGLLLCFFFSDFCDGRIRLHWASLPSLKPGDWGSRFALCSRWRSGIGAERCNFFCLLSFSDNYLESECHALQSGNVSVWFLSLMRNFSWWHKDSHPFSLLCCLNCTVDGQKCTSDHFRVKIVKTTLLKQHKTLASIWCLVTLAG